MKLTNENIAKTVEDVENFFQKSRVSRCDTIKIILLIEEALLLWQEHFGENTEFKFDKRSLFGTYKVTIKVKDKPFNPLQVEDDDEMLFSNDIMQNLLHQDAAQTIYRYENGCNKIIASSVKERKPIKIPGGITTITILAAIVCSFLIQFLPTETQNFLIQDLTPKLLKVTMDVIVAITGPFVFISIVAGVLAMDNITTFNKIGMAILRRIGMISLVIAIITAAVSEIFYSVITFKSSSGSSFDKIFDMFLSIIPTNLFTPFTEGLVLQIVMIAILTGICTLMIENVVPNFKNLMLELNRIISKMFKVVSKIIIVTIFLSIFKIMTTSSFEKIAEVWSIIAVNYIVFVIMCVLMVLRLVIKCRVNVREFFATISPLLVASFTTGSNTVSIPINFEIAKKKLKIDESLCNVFLPLSYSLFSPGATLALVVCVFYTADFYGETISITQLLLTIFLSLQLSITTPPVAGGIIPIYAMILQQMNLPTDAIGSLIMATVFVINASAVSSNIIRNCELMYMSRQIKL